MDVNIIVDFNNPTGPYFVSELPLVYVFVNEETIFGLPAVKDDDGDKVYVTINSNMVWLKDKR